MPKRPPTSGYARIAQAEEEEEGLLSEDEDPYQGHGTISNDGTRYAPIQPKRRERMQASGSASTSPRRSSYRRRRTNSGVDIKAINARLERWADEIAQKFKIRKVKGKTQEEEQLEIHHSVFQAPDWIRPATAETLATEYDNDDNGERISKLEFDDIVESVRTAIELGMHPKLISQGSSGSYFARNSGGKVVGVFKPKDEEPYANKNPKWTKWIHRNLFPFAFGRGLLIPNLSYVSEAAAYVLDSRLKTNIVPYTDVVSLSSKSFYYDFWDRRAYYRKKKPLPEKQGSFQVFLKGFKDANVFLKEHPWPDQHNSGFRTDAAPKKKRRRWAEECRPSGPPSDDEDGHGEGAHLTSHIGSQHEFWTEELQQSFREQLEKLVILDYIMRNTDRGLNNWMVRIDQQTQEASIVVHPPKKDSLNSRIPPDKADKANGHPDPYKRQESMTATNGSTSPAPADIERRVTIGAIDNSLAWPWKHPDAWRSYPFGWLFLPVSLIGQPFSEKTKMHFLPLLTSKHWWSETQVALRRCFEQDDAFNEKMFARQIAVMKGQAWNVVETLKTPDHGPLELTRRARVCVWDDLIEIPVALPMRVPSAEMRRKQTQAIPKKSSNIMEEDEMDISAAYASAPQPNHDLLGLGDHAPQANRFNMSRQNSSNDVRPSEDSNGPLSPSSVQGFTFEAGKEVRSSRPGFMRSRTRLSYEEPRHLFDDLGDLGYAAAEDQEGNRRKVIVERIEMVKSRNPVFTWC
ncbi:Phosphatidylinositol 4-kinase LSB6 [Taxawa tesnikishii (nom. ined.)]|nr:Phosphatidylinositol 4-kinase LSB6 [Dothideales sp. JES 119]